MSKRKTKPTAEQSAAAKAKAEEVRTKLVAEVIEAIKAQPLTWSKTWTDSLADGLPVNAATGQMYRGGNVLWFLIAGAFAGYSSQAWGTAKQWHSIGCRVRDDEWGNTTLGLFWKQWRRKTDRIDPDTGDAVYETLPMLRSFGVYNADQVDVIDPAKYEARGKVKRYVQPDDAEYPGSDLLECVPADVIYGPSPSYAPNSDTVRMPTLQQFTSPTEFATTFAHELVHWTGHASRLDRPKHERWGDQAYAFEELIAELGAVMFAAHVGVDYITRQNHVAYLQSWVAKLADDPQALWTAATKASAALDLLLSYGETDAEPEGDAPEPATEPEPEPTPEPEPVTPDSEPDEAGTAPMLILA